MRSGVVSPIAGQPSMTARRKYAWTLLVLLAALAAAGRAYGYGAAGHRIAGLAAQQRLCARADTEIRFLGQGQGLDELGLWADWIRSEPEWEHSAPWHYMNIPDSARLENYRHPPQGDILWAIRHFAGELRVFDAPVHRRRNALRFLAHFVVDIHQPLHVGRASDRGGNRVDVDPGRGEQVNLHQFWDTDAVALSGLAAADYARSLLDLIRANAAAWERDTLTDWVRESHALRSSVYDFGGSGNRLSRAYLDTAERLTRRRLAQAGVRLAAEINRALCSEPRG